MRSAFLFVDTEVDIEPVDSETKKLVKAISSNTIMVKTPHAMGAAIILGDSIITSLSLVSNYPLVTIILPYGEQRMAEIAQEDRRNHLAKLRPIPPIKLRRYGKEQIVQLNRQNAIGDALCMVNVAEGAPVARVGSMLYSTKVCERKENSFRIDYGEPRGGIGSGVWNLDGCLLGLLIGKKIIPNPELVISLPGEAHVYAVPSEAVFEFLETK